MNHSSIRVVATAASPLFKPDLRISRIRLSQGHFAERQTPRPSRLGQPAESSPQEKGWQSHNGSKLQVDPFPFCEHMSLAGALRSTGITRRPHYYGPLRLPIKPNIGYLFPISVDSSKTLGWGITRLGLPGSSTDLSVPAVPNHPEPPGGCTHLLLRHRFKASPNPDGWPRPFA